MPGNPPTVMVVDDDPQVREVYAAMLAENYDPIPVESGEAALEAIHDEVDVVLLDRRMLGLSGGDVLLRLREEGYEMPVAMVTAVEPDFDIIEMGFDDYLCKPVRAAELRDLVDTLVLRQEYDDVIREYFSLVSKVAALQHKKAPDELESNAAYTQSNVKLEEIKEQAQTALDTAIETGKFDELFYEHESDEHGSMPGNDHAEAVDPLADGD